MIFDHISNRHHYYFLGEDFRKALDFFATVDDTPFEKSDIIVPGSNILVKARPMMNKPESECSFEAHRNDADIHFVAYGEEKIGIAPLREMQEIGYNAEKDLIAVEGKGDVVLLRKGYFMITLPQDAHMPCIAPGELKPLGKMIAKIPMK